LIEAIVQNMRTNLEELRYSTIAPTRYTVYISQSEHARLEGILPRLQAEAMRALTEELDRLNRRWRLRAVLGRLAGRQRPLQHADARWHVEFLPDLDGELRHEHDIVVHSELVLPGEPDLTGERTRRVTTRRTESASPVLESTGPGLKTGASGSHNGVPGLQTGTTSGGPGLQTATTSGGPGLQTGAHTRGTAETSPSRVVHARLSYEDQRGAHRFDIVRDSTTIGRGGTMYPVDVRVATTDDVSREHARIHRAVTGEFYLIDLSTHGTTIDGVRVPRGYDEDASGKRENGAQTPLPHGARIGLAETVFVRFEKIA
jgi:hypothetical protein